MHVAGIGGLCGWLMAGGGSGFAGLSMHCESCVVNAVALGMLRLISERDEQLGS